MKWWPKRRTGTHRDDDEDALGSYGEAAPSAFEPKGPPRLYADEIDEDWRDPITEDPDLDGDAED